MELRSR
jgi:hypothetical protein